MCQHHADPCLVRSQCGEDTKCRSVLTSQYLNVPLKLPRILERIYIDLSSGLQGHRAITMQQGCL